MKNLLSGLPNFKKITPTAWVLALAFVFCGLFYEVLSAVCSVFLCTLIFLKAKKQKGLKIYANSLSLSVALIFLFYVITIFWAADGGMAPFGIIKFLPLPLFMILLMQESENETPSSLFSILPPLAAALTLLSSVLGQVPRLKPYFMVNGRLAGFFGYPNTFALVLLVVFIYTVLKEKINWLDILYLCVFVFGILYSGSRTAFILLVISAILIVFKKAKTKAKKLLLTVAVLGGIAVLGTVLALLGFTESIGRFLTTSVFSSTFVGRFLYFYDALPVIIKNPFGLGYLGYYSVEQSIQSGLYSVRFIHNDFLQLLLDIGWAPTALFVFAVAKRFFKKGTDFKTRILIFVITAHSLFDFNLQFIFVFMLYLALLNENSGKEIKVKKKALILLPVTVFTVVSLYFAVAQGLYYLGKYDAATKIYPSYTEAKQKQLTLETDANEISKLANEILQLNPNCSLAFSAKANYFFALGNVEATLTQMDLAIKNAPFAYSKYEKTAYILQTAIRMYGAAGDEKSADYCKRKLISLNEELLAVKNKISPLGRMITDQPTTQFPKETNEYIKGLEYED